MTATLEKPVFYTTWHSPLGQLLLAGDEHALRALQLPNRHARGHDWLDRIVDLGKVSAPKTGMGQPGTGKCRRAYVEMALIGNKEKSLPAKKRRPAKGGAHIVNIKVWIHKLRLIRRG